MTNTLSCKESVKLPLSSLLSVWVYATRTAEWMNVSLQGQKMKVSTNKPYTLLMFRESLNIFAWRTPSPEQHNTGYAHVWRLLTCSLHVWMITIHLMHAAHTAQHHPWINGVLNKLQLVISMLYSCMDPLRFLYPEALSTQPHRDPCFLLRCALITRRKYYE